jgi:hypothetical protein
MVLEQEFARTLHRSVAPLFDPYHAQNFIDEHLRVANFRLPTDASPSPDADRSYESNEDFWRDIMQTQRRLRANTTIALNNFKVTEWVPRAPGVFHTGDGRASREMALNFVLPSDRYMPLASSLNELDDLSASARQTLVVFDPYGKGSMIHGGIGCIRTKAWRPRKDEHEEDWWLLGATSSAVVHEGLPVRLPNRLYQRFIDDIEDGGLNCSLIGKVRFVPDELVTLYAHARGIPKVYIEVDNIRPQPLPSRRRGCLVSAAVGFQSDYEGRPSLYASYVTFDSGDARSLDQAANWLEEIYIHRMYHGRVLTDFDQQSTRFEGAVFSLDCLLRTQVNETAVRETVVALALGTETDRIIAGLAQVRTIHIEKVEHMAKNQTIRFGDHATVSAPVIIADEITGSFNIIQQSQADPALKTVLDDLLKTVAEVSGGPNVSEQQARSMARDADGLAKEATDKEPRDDACRSFLSRLGETARAIGEAGVPVLNAVSDVMGFFTG